MAEQQLPPQPGQVGEVHPHPDEPPGEPAFVADDPEGGWVAKNLPLAIGAGVLMVGALLIILFFAYQLVPR